MRSINSATLTFGLVSIPVKMFTAASSEGVSFNRMTALGNRVKQTLHDSVTDAVVEQKDCNSGYEYAKDQYVVFTGDELKSLETEKSKTMDIREFVDAASVDLVQVEKSYYLGPDKGGDKGYQLLASTMKAMGKVAVAQWNGRGKEQLVVIRPFRDGLVLHQMYYANEVRNFDEVEVAKLAIADAERDMAGKLIQMLSTGPFDPAKYEDGHVKRVKAAVERKIAGLGPEAVEATPAPKATVVDLLARLQASIDAVSKK
jgi:DNA end-binding protein Ku